MLGLSPPLRMLINAAYLRERALIRRVERASRDEIEAIRLHRLRATLRNAAEGSAHYRRVFSEAGLDPSAVRYPDELRKLPLLSKRDLQQGLGELRSTALPADAYEVVTTGGSEGTPVKFYQQRGVTYARTYAHEWRQYAWAGIRPFGRRARIRGAVLPALTQRQGGTLLISSFRLTADNALGLLGELRAFRPRYLEAYPSSALLLARALAQQNVQPRVPGMKAIVLSSESVEEPELDELRRAFGCAVFNKYGSSEQVCMIGQCSAGGYHEFEDYAYVEYVGQDGEPVADGMAEIVGTGYVNQATPLLRYRTGDYVMLDSRGGCSCGRELRTVKRIVGRGRQYLLGAGGEQITMAAINTHSTAFDGVLQFQYFQQRAGEATIRVVPVQELTEQMVERIVAEVRHRTSGLIRFEVQRVEQVEKTPQGKALPIVRRCEA